MNPYAFRAWRPLGLRIWHWLDALAITGLLGTVLLRKTFLSWRTNSAYLETTLREAGTEISPELAKKLAVGLRDPMWDWHYVFGFTLVGLLVLRVVVALLSPEQRPFASAVRALRGLGTVGAAERTDARHYTAVKLFYALFYVVVAYMAVSGPLMYFSSELGLAKSVVDGLKEVHETAMWFFVAFAGVHVFGIVAAEVRGQAGLVSDMISGGEKPKPGG